ncbi:MAG: septum formation initiator family protein [Vallitalea sp.]|nr:septum formation initiator family protein [Vallitalea sp.]
MRKKRRKTKAVLFSTIVLIILIVAVSIKITSLYSLNKELKQNEAELEKKIQLENDRYIKLLNQREYIKTDEYIEQLGREKFGLVKPGEFIFINKEDE